MTNKKLPRIERRETRIIVPHENGKAVFIYPSQGPHTYQTFGKEIIARGLNVPTGEYNASLLHSAYCSVARDEPEFKELKDHMKRGGWLWTFNHNLWTSEGLYVVTDPRAEGLGKDLSVTQLEKRLKGARELSWGGIRFSKDGSVRFAPEGSYDLGDQTPESLAKQGDVVANYLERGAEKLGEISESKYFVLGPKTWGVKVSKGEEPVQKIASLTSIDDRLIVDGDSWDDYSNGYAFGVSKWRLRRAFGMLNKSRSDTPKN